MKKHPKKQDKKTNNFIESARQLFLTLSQTSLSVDEVYDKLLAEDKLEHLAVVLETHTADVNKGKHIHVYLSYLKRRKLSLRHFDFLQPGVHVEKVKNTECLLAYMNKENECKSNFDMWHSLLNHSAAMASKTVLQMVKLGWNLKDIQVHYDSILINKPWEKISKFVLARQNNAYDLSKAKSLSDQLRWIDRSLIEARLSSSELKIFDSDPQFQILVDYINKIKKFGSDQIHKECCLSIVAEPSTGKSSLLLKLAKHYNNYNFPMDGWHRDNYRNNFFSMWTWNEWEMSSVPWSDLMLLLEGFETDLRVKGSKTIKLDRPMLFLLSNDTFFELFEKRYGYLRSTYPRSFSVRQKALSVRIRELNFGEQTLFFLQKLLVGVSQDITSFQE